MHHLALTRRRFLKALSGSLCTLPAACGRRPGDSQEAQVEAALARLLQRDETMLPGGDGLPDAVLRPHVLFEEATTKKFVQFTGSRSDSLMLDFPTSSLNADERERAKAFFGVLAARRQPLPGDEVAYNVNLGNDTKRAAQLTMRAFREIYRLGDGFRLRMQEE